MKFFMTSMKEWIDCNVHGSMRIDDVVKKSGYSKWHLQRLFKKHAGKTLGVYIREKKMEVAANDLVNSNENIIDICYKHRFESQQTFTRMFRKQFNTPPKKYRKEKKAIVVMDDS